MLYRRYFQPCGLYFDTSAAISGAYLLALSNSYRSSTHGLSHRTDLLGDILCMRGFHTGCAILPLLQASESPVIQFQSHSLCHIAFSHSAHVNRARRVEISCSISRSLTCCGRCCIGCSAGRAWRPAIFHSLFVEIRQAA